MRIKGRELKDFMDTGWPGDDWFWDHDEFDPDPDPETVYDTYDLGGLYYQGAGEDPTHGEGKNLDSAIRRWRKDRTTRVVTIRVPNELSDKELRAHLKPIKGAIEPL